MLLESWLIFPHDPILFSTANALCQRLAYMAWSFTLFLFKLYVLSEQLCSPFHLILEGGFLKWLSLCCFLNALCQLLAEQSYMIYEQLHMFNSPAYSRLVFLKLPLCQLLRRNYLWSLSSCMVNLSPLSIVCFIWTIMCAIRLFCLLF